MKLFYSPGACSLACHITLAETGSAFAIERADLRSKTTETGADYSTITPVPRCLRFSLKAAKC
ncbi:hypothetical protein ACFSHQ_27145 [Gemmobacter lanyuensis]